jgi:integrase
MARKTRKTHDLTDTYIDSLIDFSADTPAMRGRYWDRQVQGLRVYIGTRTYSWEYYRDTCDHGDKGHIFEKLGNFDRGMKASVVIHPNPHAQPRLVRADWHMGVEQAREAAQVITGKRIEGRQPTATRGEKDTFAAAFASYLQYLERKAADAGKPPRWAKNVRSLGNAYLLPKWGAWSLAEMSERPDAFADWVAGIKSAATANHCYRVVRAIYKRAIKRNPKLSATLPTQAVDIRKEKRVQRGMAKRDFPKWYEAWKKIEDPVRRAYHLTCLLTGLRPGELARITWADIADDKLTIGNSKTGHAIEVPLTPEIHAAIAFAGERGKPTDKVFPGCGNISGGKLRGELPVKGAALRRTWKTFAVSECKIPFEISEFLLGHIPQGVSVHYIMRWAMSSGKEIIEAQRKISKAMMAALRADDGRPKLRAVA